LDHRLKENGIDPTDIQGYAKIAYTHLEVALEVFGGSADVGIGIFAAAKLLGLDFISLATERFDLIVGKESYSTDPVRALREVLRSEKFMFNVARLGGYETRDTGTIMYERG
jgi:putative molybdopterin biosynthesis protein